MGEGKLCLEMMMIGEWGGLKIGEGELEGGKREREMKGSTSSNGWGGCGGMEGLGICGGVEEGVNC